MMIKLLVLAAICLPPQFDTSSRLIVSGTSIIDTISRKFVTWDTVYYLNQAQRGVWYEHEYAFSPIWASLLRFMSPWQTLPSLALTGVAASLLFSYLAGILLRKSGFVGGLTAPQAAQAQRLYELSPAAAFLVAGYPEAAFAFLSFAGVLLFYRRRFVASGAVFGVCCLLRSNGLLWGILFAWRFVERPCAGLFLGGALLGVGFLAPQLRLWLELCPGAEWCEHTLPLGYTYIQSKYWDNGFLHYWTPNNIPNFLFAAPTLVLLATTLKRQPREMQAVQIAYVVGALFFWHVQIITRVGSCLPGPYWALAKSGSTKWPRFFIVWALVQGVLFGAFMPPA